MGGYRCNADFWGITALTASLCFHYGSVMFLLSVFVLRWRRGLPLYW